MESLAIGNVVMNYLQGGGARDLQTLEDVVMYDNSFAQGATQKDFSNFLSLGFGERNSKFAIESAINAYGYSKGMKGFQDYSNGANGWDGTDLIFATWPNSHRNYTWSDSSKTLLKR